ncbi:hypothetical protein NF552_22825 (plasmid) [Roseomonas mucosa]|nr:hypothetical protein NF552_22825 [Roseomonas mucosa]
MQGLANFAADVGTAIAYLVPALCYLAAIATFLFGAWGFWQQAQPHNPFRASPGSPGCRWC